MREWFREWPWRRMAHTLGPLIPGQLTVVAAPTGQGKTTFLLSLASEWERAGLRVWYAGLESPRADMERLAAAWALGYDAVAVREYDLPKVDLERIQAWLDDRRVLGIAGLQFSDAETLTERTVCQLFQEAVEFAPHVIIIDHLNHGTGDYAELKRILHVLHWHVKEFASAGLVVVAAAQIKRNQMAHPIEEFYPPKLSMVEGGGFISQIAAKVLGLWRPVKAGTGAKEKKAILAGELQIVDCLTRNTMGVAVLKDRVRGNAKTFRLGIDGGRILPEPPSENVAPIGDAWEPS